MNPSAFKFKGAMQLYSKDWGISQLIEGHAAVFVELKLDSHQNVTKLFTFSVCTVTGTKVSTLICSPTCSLIIQCSLVAYRGS
jgi:clathrin heavy chain